ncbi:MAG: hypothetical protein LBS15_02510 [Endomicrobium sp.]|jgi:hypothetical protein|nr:hypothetical protein [Endomicrobium sp.]
MTYTNHYFKYYEYFPCLSKRLDKIARMEGYLDLELLIRENYYDVNFCGRIYL